MSNKKPPCFDVWVCQGRLCTAHGADAIFDGLKQAQGERPDDQERLRVLRGGCFGLCDMAANVVVRRWSSAKRRPDPGVDRLQITAKANETIYSKADLPGALRVLDAHLDGDAPVDELTLRAKENEVPPDSKTARNIRKLRSTWK